MAKLLANNPLNGLNMKANGLTKDGARELKGEGGG